MESFKGTAVGFADVFDALYRATSRYEASFGSKLLATLNPAMPVINSIVLRNPKLRHPAARSKDRVSRIHQLHAELLACFTTYLATEEGKYLVMRFRETYAGINISETKMLDLVLWQTRAKKASLGAQIPLQM